MVHLAKKLTARSYIAVAALAALLLIAGIFLLVRNHYRHTVSTIPSTSPSSSTVPSGSGGDRNSSNSSGSSNNNPQSPPDGDKGTQASSGTTLVKPSGQFVSNHHPSDSTGEEESVCNTTPGASCYIKFTKGGDTRQLEPKITDNLGSAYWRWSPATADLSSGTWTITAVAGLNGQTSTAQDAQNLEVQ